MSIDKINFSYPKGTLQSVFDNEALTALELAAKTSKKVDECVEIVNGVEQTAIEATAIVDDMYVIQNQFVTDNSDTRAQLVNDNQQYLDGLTASKVQFETDLTLEVETIVSEAEQTIQTNVNEKISELVSDGTIGNLINTETEKSIVESTGTGVIVGLNVTQQTIPNMSVNVSVGTAHLYNGKRYNQTEVKNLAISPAEAYPRIDLIYINSLGILSYAKGEAKTNPTPPTPINSLILSEINISTNTISIDASKISDKRTIKTNISDLENQIKSVSKKVGWKSPRDYGCIGDGLTDDTENLKRAFKEADFLDLRGGNYLLSDTLLITKPISVFGNGLDGMIIISPSFPINKDVFIIEPVDYYTTRYHFDNVKINSDISQNAKDIIKIINNSSKITQRVTFNNCDFRALSGGYAINIINPSSDVNPNGLAQLKITNSVLYGGIKAENIGDSCWIEKNNIKGKNIGIDISMINDMNGSASQLSIKENNIVSEKGAINLNNFRLVAIEDNNIEQSTLFLNGYAVTLKSSYQNQYSKIRGNKIQCASNVSKSSALLLENVQNITIEDNFISCSTVLDEAFNIVGRNYTIDIKNSKNIKIKPQNDIYADRGCTAIRINNMSENIDITGLKVRLYASVAKTEIAVEDSGKGTKGLIKSLNLLNGWVNFNSEFWANANYYKIDDIVSIEGRIKEGLETNNTIIFTLPEKYRPLKNKQFPILSLKLVEGVSTQVTGRITIDSATGNVSVINIGNISLSLDGISFSTNS